MTCNTFGAGTPIVIVKKGTFFVVADARVALVTATAFIVWLLLAVVSACSPSQDNGLTRPHDAAYSPAAVGTCTATDPGWHAAEPRHAVYVFEEHISGANALWNAAIWGRYGLVPLTGTTKGRIVWHRSRCFYVVPFRRLPDHPGKGPTYGAEPAEDAWPCRLVQYVCRLVQYVLDHVSSCRWSSPAYGIADLLCLGRLSVAVTTWMERQHERWHRSHYSPWCVGPAGSRTYPMTELLRKSTRLDLVGACIDAWSYAKLRARWRRFVRKCDAKKQQLYAKLRARWRRFVRKCDAKKQQLSDISLQALAICFGLLLVIGGIELNPGPPKKRTERRAPSPSSSSSSSSSPASSQDSSSSGTSGSTSTSTGSSASTNRTSQGASPRDTASAARSQDSSSSGTSWLTSSTTTSSTTNSTGASTTTSGSSSSDHAASAEMSSPPMGSVRDPYVHERFFEAEERDPLQQEAEPDQLVQFDHAQFEERDPFQGDVPPEPQLTESQVRQADEQARLAGELRSAVELMSSSKTDFDTKLKAAKGLFWISRQRNRISSKDATDVVKEVLQRQHVKPETVTSIIEQLQSECIHFDVPDDLNDGMSAADVARGAAQPGTEQQQEQPPYEAMQHRASPSAAAAAEQQQQQQQLGQGVPLNPRADFEDLMRFVDGIAAQPPAAAAAVAAENQQQQQQQQSPPARAASGSAASAASPVAAAQDAAAPAPSREMNAQRACGINACASCGVFLNNTTYEPKMKRKQHTLQLGNKDSPLHAKLNEAFKLTQTQIAEAKRMEAAIGNVPVLYRHEGTMVGLYAELCDADRGGAFHLCADCYRPAANKGRAPPYSIASGLIIAFHAHLPPPTLLERSCISVHRLYGTILKLKQHLRALALKGHICFFEHDAPLEIAEHFKLPDGRLDSVWTLDSLRIKFVGKQEELERFKEDALNDIERIVKDDNAADPAFTLASLRLPTRKHCAAPSRREYQCINVRPSVVLGWIAAFVDGKVPEYANIQLNDATVQHLRDKLISEAKSIVQSAELLNEEGQAAAELDNDDVAHVRAEGGGTDASLITRRAGRGHESPAEVIHSIAQRCEAAKRAAVMRDRQAAPPQPRPDSEQPWAAAATPHQQRQPFMDMTNDNDNRNFFGPGAGSPLPHPVRDDGNNGGAADGSSEEPPPSEWSGAASEADSNDPNEMPPFFDDEDPTVSGSDGYAAVPLDDVLAQVFATASMPRPSVEGWGQTPASGARNGGTPQPGMPSPDGWDGGNPPDAAAAAAADREQNMQNAIDDALRYAVPGEIGIGRKDTVPDWQAGPTYLRRCWPDLFAFCLMPADTRSNSVCLARKLLFHHSGRFAACSEFVLASANRLQRAQTAALSTYAVRVRGTQVSAFVEIIQERDFAAKAAAAVANPDSVEAKRLWARISPTIRVAGANVIGSPEMRSSALSEMYALALLLGLPSMFVTLSPDDVHTGFVLRIHRFLRRSAARRFSEALADPDNVRVPRPAAEGAAAAAAAGGDDAAGAAIRLANDPAAVLREGDTELLFEWRPPTDNDGYARLFHARSANSASLAGIAACVFHDFIDCFMEMAVGVRVRSAGSFAALREAFLTPAKQRRCGIFGEAEGWHGVYECQAKGSLHVHGVVYGGLRPELLSRSNYDAELRQIAAAALDSQVMAQCGPHYNEFFVPYEKRCQPQNTSAVPFKTPTIRECVAQAYGLVCKLLDEHDQQQQQQQRDGVAAAAADDDGAAPAAADEAAGAAKRLPEHLPLDDAARAVRQRLHEAMQPDAQRRGAAGAFDRVFMDLVMWCPCEAHKILRDRIVCYQVHSHCQTCFKKGCLCRMGFPTASPTKTQPLELLKVFLEATPAQQRQQSPLLAQIVEISRAQLWQTAEGTPIDARSPAPANPAARADEDEDEDEDGAARQENPAAAAEADGAVDGEEQQADAGDVAALAVNAVREPTVQQPQQRAAPTIGEAALMTADRAFYKVNAVPVEEVEEMFPQPDELAKRRAHQPKRKRPTPLEAAGIKRDHRVIVWSLDRAELDFDICPYSLAMLAVFGCNCAIVPLGSSESAVAVAFYMCNYMVKDGLKVEHALPVIKDAAARAMMYRSRADDRDQQPRINNFSLQLVLHGVHTIAELHVTMAGSMMLHRKTHECSHTFEWVYPIHAVQLALTMHGPAAPSQCPIGRAGRRRAGEPEQGFGGRAFRDADDTSSAASSAVSGEDDEEAEEEEEEQEGEVEGESESSQDEPQAVQQQQQPGQGVPLNPRADFEDLMRFVDGIAAQPPAAAAAVAAEHQQLQSVRASVADSDMSVAVTHASSIGSDFDVQGRGFNSGGNFGNDDDVGDDDDDALGERFMEAEAHRAAPLDDQEGAARTEVAMQAIVADRAGTLMLADSMRAYAYRGTSAAKAHAGLTCGDEELFRRWVRTLPPEQREAVRKEYYSEMGNTILYEWTAMIKHNCKRPDDKKKKKAGGGAAEFGENHNEDVAAELPAAAAAQRDDDDDDDAFALARGSRARSGSGSGSGARGDSDSDELGIAAPNTGPPIPVAAHLFDGEYTGFATYMMRVRASYCVPRIAGRLVTKISERSSRSELDKLAAYIGVLFTVWSVRIPPAVRNWDDFLEWFPKLDRSRDNPRQAGIASTVETMLTYSSTRYTRTMLHSYRMQFAHSKFNVNLNFAPHSVANTAREQVAVAVDAVRAANARRRAAQGPAGLVAAAALAPHRSKDAAHVQRAPQDVTVVEVTHALLLKLDADLANGTVGQRRLLQRDRFAAYDDGHATNVQFQAAYAMRNGDDNRAAEPREAALVRARPLDRATAELVRQRAAEAKAAEAEAAEARLNAMKNTLSDEQGKFFDEVVDVLDKREQVRAQPNNVAAPALTPFVRVLTAGPGCGKSFLTNTITAWCASVFGPDSDRRPLLMAYTGVAASLIDGLTVHRALLMHKKDFQLLEEEKKALKERIAAAPLLIIDEISMVGCRFFAQLIARIELASGMRFGSPEFPPLLLVGDFAQLPAVMDVTLITPLDTLVAAPGGTATERAEAQALQQGGALPPAAAPAAAPAVGRGAAAPRRVPALSLWAERIRGAYYFSRFDRFELRTQLRAVEPKQQRLVQHMVNHGTVPAIFTPPDPNGDPGNDFYIETLSMNSPPEDIAAFRWAPIITATNDMRLAYNFGQAISFAAEKGVPLVVWRKPINQANLSDEVYAGHQDPASKYYAHFVMDAPAMLLSNIVPHLSISNGTTGFCHSLTWTDKAEGEIMRKRILATPPGRIVEVSPPDFFNLVIFSRHVLPLREAGPDTPQPSADHKAYVLPVPMWTVAARYDSRGRLAMPTHRAHNVDLGFSFTFHKTQGLTFLEGVVIDPNFNSGKEAKFSSIFVGLTRVKESSKLRLLPMRSAAQQQRVERLEWDPALRQYLNGLRGLPANAGAAAAAVPAQGGGRGGGRGGRGGAAAAAQGGQRAAPPPNAVAAAAPAVAAPAPAPPALQPAAPQRGGRGGPFAGAPAAQRGGRGQGRGRAAAPAAQAGAPPAARGGRGVRGGRGNRAQPAAPRGRGGERRPRDE